MLSTIVKTSIEKSLGTTINQIRSVGGGCINDCYRIETDTAAIFCKINSAQKFPNLFESEAKGLDLLKKSKAIRVPGVIDILHVDDVQILLLEWVSETERTENFWTVFGVQLAEMHHVTNNQFGLDGDNYMGNVMQINRNESSWSVFFINNRLQPLVHQCRQKNLFNDNDVTVFQRLYEKLPGYFKDEQPALVHGDLWSGNFMCSNEVPVLIDPAVYFGHRSVDLAMTTLFGGFRQPFYDAYNYHYPFDDNYEMQWRISNLYPLLIHLLLFGSSYADQIRRTLQQFS